MKESSSISKEISATSCNDEILLVSPISWNSYKKISTTKIKLSVGDSSPSSEYQPEGALQTPADEFLGNSTSRRLFSKL